MSRRKLAHEFRLTRRSLLRGATAGGLVGLALPLLENMLNYNGTAHADGSPIPRRFITWAFGNGCRLEHWVPSEQGPNYNAPAELAPLESVKDHCTVLTGFRNYVAGRRGHHDGMAGCFSAHPFMQLDSGSAPYASKFGGPSIDQVIADLIAGDSFLKSIQVGVSKLHLTDQGPTLQTMSHRGPDQPILAERDPQTLYDTLFNAFMPPDDPEQAVRARALDAVLMDVKRLKERTSAADRLRLDAHLESVFQLQKQILAIPPSCDLPPKPEPLVDPPDEPLAEINAVMSSLVTMALSCDLTRVASFMFTGPSGGAHFNDLPPSAFPEFPNESDYSHADHHQVSHSNADYEQTFIHKSVVFTMQNFAQLIEKMKATPEGANSLLDHSCVLMSSGVAEGWNHSEVDYPLIVAGGAGGNLKPQVGHYRSPDEESISNVLLACVNAVAPDAGVTEIGSNAGPYLGLSTTPCTAILT